jgi:hypothetical protein
MKIIKAKFVADKFKVRNRITGTVTLPVGAKIVHVGADPEERGNVSVWAEVTSLEIPGSAAVPLLILKAGDEVPDNCVFRGMLLAAPMLLIYETPVPGAVNDGN